VRCPCELVELGVSGSQVGNLPAIAPPICPSWSTKCWMVWMPLKPGIEASDQRGVMAYSCSSAHHGHDDAAGPSQGHHTSEVLSPTPPVEYLSISALRYATSDDLARQHHLLGQDRRLLRGHVGKVDRHEKRRQLVLWHFAIQRRVQ